MKPKEITKPFTTLGEHIHQARPERKLYQKDVAHIRKVSMYTVMNWEKNRTEPPITLIAAIIAFLGYDPFPKPQSLEERMLAHRRKHGLTILASAKALGIDEGTWKSWEESGEIPWERNRRVVEGYLNERM